jgi:predicted AlkP superfamily phosphohydrolase/phosphomutase/tetratricopeptide (TPR) repeat protein
MADGNANGRKVLLVGWDAADWNVIRPLMDAGKMPNIHRLVRDGCTASIATLRPSFSPMLWTSIATGKRPFRHGIHGFTEPRPDGRGVHRITNLSRKCKALWNILNQHGMRSIVVGWWPSYPAEPISGVMVSDQFHRISPDFRLVPGMVHPPHIGEQLEPLRLNPEDLPLDLLEFFVPRAREVDQQSDRRLLSAARMVAECANIHTAATWLMDREPWDLCAVYFDAIDHFGHGFMKFNPPRRNWVPEEDFALYRDVLQAGYLLQDKMLGTLVNKANAKANGANEDTTVVLLSDHGFHHGGLRTAFIPQLHAGPASEHRNNGVFAIAGPGIRQGVELPGVNLLDITPTVLALFGLPVGADMDGRALSGVFETPAAIRQIPSWEKVEGDDGCHPPHMQLDPVAVTESLEQLVALGYVEEPDADHEKTVKRTVIDLRTNLAEAFQDAGRHTEAATILRELREGDRDDQRVALNLFLSAQALRRTGEMAAIAEDWAGRRRELYDQALARVNELRSLARQLAQQAGQDVTEPLLNQEQRAELKRLRRVCRYDPSLAYYFQAQVFRVQRRWSDALASLDRIPPADLLRPGLFTDRAELLGRLNRWPQARGLLAEGLESDPSDARLHFCCSRVLLHDGDFRGAAHSALNGLALLDQDPVGHYLLGIALTGLGRYEQAAGAFTRALGINPNFPQAHLWLARIYRRYLAEGRKASAHSRLYSELQEKRHRTTAATPDARSIAPGPRPVAFAASARELPPITDEAVIVSGLPRSGTSMLMQMLVAGGLTSLADGLRQPDEDNPRGYFEFEPVKQMAQGAAWIEQARGKVVKIVAPMIQYLPEGVPCRVILIERDLDEILASQRQMIARRRREVDQNPARLNRLKQEYLRLIVWAKGYLAGRPNTKLMCVDRNAILRDPQRAAEAMNRFLGSNLDVARMAAEVDPKLHRQRGGFTTSLK